VTAEEIRALHLMRQHLTIQDDMNTVVQTLCGVQAQFLSNAFHALTIRCVDFSEAHARETLLKSWTIRGTMHLFNPEDLPLFLHKDRKCTLRLCDTMESDEMVSQNRKKYFAKIILEAVANGKGEREQLKTICTTAGMTESEEESLFNPWGGLLRALCEEGRICHVVQEKKAFQICPVFEPMEAQTARLEMTRRYFQSFGPASFTDAAYFFGVSQTAVKQCVKQLPLSSFVYNGTEYFDTERQVPSQPVPECLFLSGFDQLMMGYEKHANLHLPVERLRGIFNLSGIVMPSVLVNGKVAGRWKKAGKRLKITLFEKDTSQLRKIISENAGILWPELKQVDYE